jgi:hypothetical protein
MANPPSYITLGNMFFDVWLLWFSFILFHRSGVLFIFCFLQKQNEKEASEKKYYDSKSFVNGE